MRKVETTIEKLKEQQEALSTSVNNHKRQEDEIKANVKYANAELKKLDKKIQETDAEYVNLGIKEAQAIKGKEKAEEKHDEALSKLAELTCEIYDATGVLNILNKNIGKANNEIEAIKARKTKAIEKYYAEIRENCEKIKKLAS